MKKRSTRYCCEVSFDSIETFGDSQFVFMANGRDSFVELLPCMFTLTYFLYFTTCSI